MHSDFRAPRPSSAPAVALAAFMLGLLLASPAIARIDGQLPFLGDKDGQGEFVLDGSFVHNVGQAHMNITNWGLLGSRPGSATPYSDSPSFQWPAGSGVEYLWAAGLWVGAIVNGVPAVSTGQFQFEFLPDGNDPLQTIYEARQGESGGARYPDPSEDDDDDGFIDEDPKDAIDNDSDGLIDEDFAAIGNQHFRCEYTDYSSLSRDFWPDHEPLNLNVIQESFQWENESVDDFVGFQFTLTATGQSGLDDVFLGFFADCDIGPRGQAEVANDDLPGFAKVNVRAKDGSTVPLSVAYMYDFDGDSGTALGYFGIMFLNHDIDPTGDEAPTEVGITSFQQFSGQAPFDRGGDPTNDAERYELMSRPEFDSFPVEESRANDFRIMLATGPFSSMNNGDTLQFQAACVVGDGLGGLLRNAAESALTYYGAYFDRDLDISTGIKGRERRTCTSDWPDAPQNVGNPIFSLFVDCVDSLDLIGDAPPQPIQPEDLDADGCIFLNADCAFELVRTVSEDICLQDGEGVDPALLAGCTGVEGKEFNVPWLVGLAPSPPNMRLWQTNNRIHIFFNNLSELEKDVRLQKIDFESYRIWRAEGWERPFGTSIDNGPESKLWRLIAEYDVVDSFTASRELNTGADQVQHLPLGRNTGLEEIEYVPFAMREGSRESIEYAGLAALLEQIIRENPSVSSATLIRYLDENGDLTFLGERYPELGEWTCCYAQVDSLYWSKLDPPIKFYEYVDREAHNGIYYFYSVTATDFTLDPGAPTIRPTGPGLAGDPQSNFRFAIPKSDAQTPEDRAKYGQDIYVVPNPATREALAEFSQLNPNSDDPTGVRVEFRNLPRAQNTVRVYTLSGDLITEMPHDGSDGDGSLSWNLVSRNGQEIVSGIYLYSVESSDDRFNRIVGRFVVIR